MGSWYKVTKRIHGRYYDYWQRTYRIGKSVKTENKYIGPSFGRNDRVMFVHKETSATQTRNVRRVESGALIVTDDISGIPYRASLNTCKFRMVTNGDPNARPPKSGTPSRNLLNKKRVRNRKRNEQKPIRPKSVPPTLVAVVSCCSGGHGLRQPDPNTVRGACQYPAGSITSCTFACP